MSKVDHHPIHRHSGDALTVRPGEPVTYYAVAPDKRQRIDTTAFANAKPDIVSAVIMALDAQLACSRALDYASPLAILPRAEEWEDVRHAVLLWGGAHGCRRENKEGTEASGGIATLRLYVGRDMLVSVHVPEECDFDPKRNDDQMWVPCGAV